MHKLKTDIQHNEKGQKGKQRFTKEYTKNKARQIRTALKIGGELGCSGRVGSSCTISGYRRGTLNYKPGDNIPFKNKKHCLLEQEIINTAIASKASDVLESLALTLSYLI